MKDIFEKLKVPFSAAQIAWRKGFISEDKTLAQALPYLNARLVQNRLDDVVSPENWCNKFSEVIANGRLVAIRCAIGIRIEGEWIFKEDAAQFDAQTASNRPEAALKWAYSDAFKRAAVQWGVGRYLYAYAPQMVALDATGELSVIPGLSAEFLPESEAHLAGQALEAKVTGVPSEQKVHADTSNGPAEKTEVERTPEKTAEKAPHEVQTTEAPSSEPESTAVTPESAPASPAPAEMAAPTEPATPANDVPPAASGGITPPADIPEKEQQLMNDLLDKMNKLPVPVIRAYINGPKSKEKLSEGVRSYLLALLDQKESAAKAA